MSALLQGPVEGASIRPVRGDDVVLATGDPAWAGVALAALQADPLGLGAPRRVETLRGIAPELARGARLWIVDEDLAVPLLAHRRLEPRAAQPDLLVRFAQFATPRVIAVIESGARGCLPPQASVAETVEAVRAVLAGELWLSRRLFSAVLDHMQARVGREASGEADDDALTGRQREIVRYVARGLSNKQIGRILGISPTTVKTHLHNIFERLGVGGRTMLALRANEPRTH